MTDTIVRLQETIPGLAFSEFRGQKRITTPKETLFDTLRKLKEDFGFDLLVDITCVDYLHYGAAAGRFGLVYVLVNTLTNERLIVRCFMDDEPPTVKTVTDLWEAANWLEREVWDMFGVRFAGHPDLRRILLPEGFPAHPLRKDYPLQGRGERHNLPVIRRG